MFGGKRSDAERRQKQAKKFARIFCVHRLAEGTLGEEKAKAIAKLLKVTPRTVYRDWSVLQETYKILGSNKLD